MFRKLLIPLDQSSFAEQALVPAVTIARAAKARLDVMLVHPRRSTTDTRWSPWVPEQTREEQLYVERIAARLAAHEQIGTTFTVMEGDIVDCISARALYIGAGLIVMTSHGYTGINRMRLGSIADGLIRKSSTPVLMMRASHDVRNGATPTGAPFAPFRRILLPLDGSIASTKVFAAALELARGTGAQLVLLRVIPPVAAKTADIGMMAVSVASTLAPYLPSSMQDADATERLRSTVAGELADTAELLKSRGAMSIESHVIVADHVGTAIVDFATTTRADVIAMTTHGSGVSRWLIGSVTDAVVKRTELPMLITGQATVANAAAAPRADNLQHRATVAV